MKFAAAADAATARVSMFFADSGSRMADELNKNHAAPITSIVESNRVMTRVYLIWTYIKIYAAVCLLKLQL